MQNNALPSSYKNCSDYCNTFFSLLPVHNTTYLLNAIDAGMKSGIFSNTKYTCALFYSFHCYCCTSWFREIHYSINSLNDESKESHIRICFEIDCWVDNHQEICDYYCWDDRTKKLANCKETQRFRRLDACKKLRNSFQLQKKHCESNTNTYYFVNA